jgi:hypothetical protein
MRSGVAFQETLPRPEPAPREPHPLADRLQACSRLLATAADELAALERGDSTKRRELSELREEIVREMLPTAASDGEEADDDDVATPPTHAALLPHVVAELLAEVLDALEEREEQERRMHDRWSSLEEDALKAIHVGGRIVSLRAGRYPNETPNDARLDLRF